MNPKGSTPRCIIIKISKALKQLITYKGDPIRLSTYFSAETFQVRREWHDVFKGLKGKKKNKTTNQEYSTRQDYHSGQKGKNGFPDKQKPKDFITTKPAFQEMLKELF